MIKIPLFIVLLAIAHYIAPKLGITTQQMSIRTFCFVVLTYAALIVLEELIKCLLP